MSEDFEYSVAWYDGPYMRDQHELDETTPAAILRKWERKGYRRRCLDVWRRLPEPIRGRVLDAGTGFGKTAVWLLREYPQAEVWGVDWSARAIRFCGRYGERRFHPIRADVCRMPFAQEWFDWIVCTDLCEHLPEAVYEEAIKEMARVCRLGGRLLLFQGNTRRPEHIHRISDKEMVADFTAAGFRWLADLPHRHILMEKTHGPPAPADGYGQERVRR